MASLDDIFFGGAERDAAKAQQKSALDQQGMITQGVNQARSDMSQLFPAAQRDLNQGFGGAMGVFGSMLPQQSNIYQQGNVAAQEQLLAGLPQIQAALLGGNIDYSALQPTQLQQPDYGSMIPDFSSLFGGGNNFTPTNPNSPALNPALNEGPQQYTMPTGGADQMAIEGRKAMIDLPNSFISDKMRADLQAQIDAKVASTRANEAPAFDMAGFLGGGPIQYPIQQPNQQPQQYFNRTSALTGNPTIDSYAARSRNERGY